MLKFFINNSYMLLHIIAGNRKFICNCLIRFADRNFFKYLFL